MPLAAKKLVGGNYGLNFRQIEENHTMENIIYNELRYRGYQVDVGSFEELFVSMNQIMKRMERIVEIFGMSNKQERMVKSSLVHAFNKEKWFVSISQTMKRIWNEWNE